MKNSIALILKGLVLSTLVLNASSVLATDIKVREKNGVVTAEIDTPGAGLGLWYLIDTQTQLCFAMGPLGGATVHIVPCEVLARRPELRPYINSGADSPESVD